MGVCIPFWCRSVSSHHSAKFLFSTCIFLGVTRICTVINRPMLVGRFSGADLVPRSSLYMPPVPTVYNGLYPFLVQIRFFASFCKISIFHVYILLSNHYLHRHQPAH